MPRRLSRTPLVAAALVLAPFGAWAADLVVWWEEGYYPGEDQAVRETVAAFERKTGKQVELAFHTLDDLPGRTAAAVAAGDPPDLVFNQQSNADHARWAHEGRLVDLADALGPFATQFDPDALERATLLDATTGRRGLYGLCRWATTPTTSTSGRACSGAPASPSPTSPRGGTRSGPSGARRSSPPSARRPAATTSGAWASRCRRRGTTPRPSSGSS